MQPFSAQAQTPPMAVAMSDFDPFLSSELGVELLGSEREAVEAQLPPLAGYNLL